MPIDQKDVLRPRKVLVVGGGPVGALTALSLHKRGWNVEVWETRDGEFDFDFDLSEEPRSEWGFGRPRPLSYISSTAN
jgi:pyruvate/2-oxoglutarate dehydrogenase complex dihydrolipoamide dehydrogenase (E3) component